VVIRPPLRYDPRMSVHVMTKKVEIPTLGVELEYQILDPVTRELSSDTQVVLQEGSGDLRIPYPPRVPRPGGGMCHHRVPNRQGHP
jgi:hypothetical protein